MADRMKTTVEIADQLLEETRELARRENTTIGALVERGLRMVLDEADSPTKTFQLRKASFGGRGLQPGLTDESWAGIRSLAYESRGE